jgi:hypothetical protein
MVKIAIVDPKNDPRWNKFVDDHPLGWIVHLSGWQTVLENSFPHMRGHYLALTDLTDNQILVALPFFEVRSWLLGNRKISIPYATLCAPLISNREQLNILLKEVINSTDQSLFNSFTMRMFQSFPIVQDMDLIIDYSFKTHQLQLLNDPEETKKTFSRNVLRNIKKVDTGELSLRIGNGQTDLSIFYQLYCKTRKRLGLPSHPYSFSKNLFNVFSPQNRIALLFAENKGKAVGGLIVFKYKDRVSSEYLASDIAFRQMHIDYFLHWKAIAMACRDGFKIYDFGRTAFNNSSLMEFKRKWGTDELDLPQYRYSKDAHEESINLESSLFYRWTFNVCKYAPDFAYSLIGKLCYRHLG